MTKLQFAAGLLEDFERIAAHLAAHEVADVPGRLAELVQGLDLLTQHPFIGRRAQNGWRELVIGRDARGYVARYRYDAAADLVRVVAVRAQREAGFAGD